MYHGANKYLVLVNVLKIHFSLYMGNASSSCHQKIFMHFLFILAPSKLEGLTWVVCQLEYYVGSSPCFLQFGFGVYIFNMASVFSCVGCSKAVIREFGDLYYSCFNFDIALVWFFSSYLLYLSPYFFALCLRNCCLKQDWKYPVFLFFSKSFIVSAIVIIEI